MLHDVDPVTAARLHENDVRRIVRALEVYRITGVPFSQQEQLTQDATYDYRVITLDMDRNQLYDRVNRRVDLMMEDGLLDEVDHLLKMGLTPLNQSMKGIGYKELCPVLIDHANL